MAQVPDNLMIEDPSLKACLDSIELAVRNIWKLQLLQNYTDHSNEHSDRIIKALWRLLDDYGSRLNEHERFVLLSSAYLHDIGMQSPKDAGLENKERYSEDEEMQIREMHNETSAKMIIKSVSKESSLKLGLEMCPRMAKEIAKVCKYHRCLDLNELENSSISGERIRVRLLAGLLRLGDELDADHRRVKMEVLKTRDIPTTSKYHWWGHHYVRSVDIDNRQITLRFEFPQEYKDSNLIKMLRDEVMNSLERQYYEVYDLFFDHGFRLYREVKYIEVYSEGLELIPDDLKSYILKKISQSEVTPLNMSIQSSLDERAEITRIPLIKTQDEFELDRCSNLKLAGISAADALEKLVTKCHNTEVAKTANSAIFLLREIEKQESLNGLALAVGEAAESLEILAENAARQNCYELMLTAARILGIIGVESAPRKELAEAAYAAVDRLDKIIKFIVEIEQFDTQSAVIAQAVKDLGIIGEKAAENGIINVSSRSVFAFGSIGLAAVNRNVDIKIIKSCLELIFDAAKKAAKSDNNMGSVIYQLGRTYNILNCCPEAEVALRKAIGIDHPQRIHALLQLYGALRCQDKDIEAKAALDEYKKLKWQEQMGNELAECLLNEKVQGNISCLQKYGVTLDQALKLADNALKAANSSYEKGLALTMMGNFGDAEQEFGESINLYPDNGEYYFARGNTRFLQGNYAGACKDYSEALKIDPNFVYAWSNKGSALSKLGRHYRALAAYKRAIKLDPKLALIWVNMSATLIYLGEFNEALATSERAIKLDPKLAPAWDNKGSALDKLGQYNEALAAFQTAIELNPDLATAWKNKSAVYIGLGDLKKALSAAQMAIKLDPDLASAWNNKSAVLIDLGEFDEALAASLKAIELDANLPIAWINKGSALINLNRPGEALEASRKAVDLDPKSARGWSNISTALSELGQYEDALEASHKAIGLDPKHASAWASKGASLLKLEKPNEALEAFNKAIELDSKRISTWINKAAVQFILEKYKEALESLDRAIKLDPYNALAWNNKGATLNKLSRNKEALEAFEKSLEINPKFALAIENRDMILKELATTPPKSSNIEDGAD